MTLLTDFELDEEEKEMSDCESRCFPNIELIRPGSNNLSPKPPDGWWAVVSLCPSPGLHYPPELGVWMLMLWDIQAWEKHEGFGYSHKAKRKHCICRDEGGRRILMVHPDLRELAHERLEEYDSAARSGEDFLAPDYVEKALVTYAGRLWDKASPAQRMYAAHDFLQNYNVPLSVIVQSSEWMKEYGCMWGMYELAEHLTDSKFA